MLMIIIRADLIAGPGKVVVEFTDDIRLDFRLAASVPRQIDRAGDSLRALDSFRMIMRPAFPLYYSIFMLSSLVVNFVSRRKSF